MSPTAIQRKQLLNALLHKRNVTNVDVREITLGPGQHSGRHLHLPALSSDTLFLERPSIRSKAKPRRHCLSDPPSTNLLKPSSPTSATPRTAFR